MIATARTEATALTFQKVQHLLTPQMASDLDRLLMVDVGLGKTRLARLNERAVEATAASVKATTERLQFLRGMDAHTLDLTTLPAERRRFLASVGRRSTNQALERREPQRRHPILLALLGQSAIDVLDELVAVFDQAISARESHGQRFPVRGKSTTARHKNVFGGQVLLTYTHVSDQYATYGTRVMVPIHREAHYVLMRCSATPWICRSPSMPPILMASPSLTSPCSTWSGCCCHRGSGTWERSRCAGPTRHGIWRLASPMPVRC